MALEYKCLVCGRVYHTATNVGPNSILTSSGLCPLKEERDGHILREKKSGKLHKMSDCEMKFALEYNREDYEVVLLRGR